jgi:hypothetical protein
MELPLVTRRTCGPCTACCVTYPLLPEEGFWPEGKPAYTPCKFLCKNGCSIHDRPRPPVCTDYHCAYINEVVPHRPSECGVLFTRKEVHNLFEGDPPLPFPPHGCGIHVVETCPGAVLQLSSRQVRYWFRRTLWFVACVQPYGIDVSQHPVLYRWQHDVAVVIHDDPAYDAYADKVIACHPFGRRT